MITVRMEEQSRCRVNVSEQWKGEDGLLQHSVALGRRLDVAVKSYEDFLFRNTACMERTRDREILSLIFFGSLVTTFSNNFKSRGLVYFFPLGN